MTVEFPDVNHYHPITDESEYAASGAPAVCFKVGGDAEDSTWKAHDAIGVRHDLVRIGYWLPPDPPGAALVSAAAFIKTFSPAVGRIPALDDESYLDSAWRSAFCSAVSLAWQRLCWYYGAEGRTAGAAYPKWTAGYTTRMPTDNWVAWQFSNGLVPTKHTWPGVSGNCDMNQLSIGRDVAWLRLQAGLEDDVALTEEECKGLAKDFGEQRRWNGSPRPKDKSYTGSDAKDHSASAQVGWDIANETIAFFGLGSKYPVK
jgi:hypothetical protein